MFAGAFHRGETPPTELDTRYQWVVVPWRVHWDEAWTEAALVYQHLGIKVLVHTPGAYHNPTYTGSPHDEYKALLDANGGWLKSPSGEMVGPTGADTWKYIDPRFPKVRRLLAEFHAERVAKGFKPDGLFFDFVHDRVTWRPDFDSLTGVQKRALDTDYREAMRKYIVGLKFQLGKRGVDDLIIYGNGWHRCTACDGIVYEHFPNTRHEGGERSFRVALEGYYGQDTWRLFRLPPMFMPENDEPGHEPCDHISKIMVVNTVSFAQAYAPNGCVLENSGYIFDVMDRVEDLDHNW